LLESKVETVLLQADSLIMADGSEDVQPLVCDNGSGMVKVMGKPFQCVILSNLRKCSWNELKGILFSFGMKLILS
jgi:hypothetical protein